MQEKERIAYLFERYYQNALSEEETLELSRVLDEAEEDLLIEKLTKAITNLSETQDTDLQVEDDVIKQKVEEILAIDRQSTHHPTKKITRPGKLWYSIAAAAVLILGFYLIFNQSKNSLKDINIVATTNSYDVQPGQEGGILVLSDGTEIFIDSTTNNQIITDKDGSKIKIVNKQIVYLDGKEHTKESYNTVKTPKGKQYQLLLADGTKVWLNAASSIKYPTTFTGKYRKVVVTGESYFEVAKNPSKPFIVNIDNSETNIEVLGTHFNINAYADEGYYKTTLLEGSIGLNVAKKQIILKPNQQVANHPNSSDFKLIDNIEPEEIIAWKNNLFHFNASSIDDVMREFSRWYDIDVIYEGEKPTGTYTGKIEKNLTLRQTLKILGSTSVKYKLTQDNKLLIQ